MRKQAIFAATLVLPLLLLACNRADHASTASVPSQDKQAQSQPSSPDKMLENSPPAAGMSPPQSSTEPSSPSSSTPPADNTPSSKPSETGKGY